MMQKKRNLLGLMLLLVLAPFLHAQTTESLLIGPGDVLHVHVFDTPEMEQQARVTDSGEFSLLIGGSVKVAGLTPDAAAHVIEQALIDRHLMLHPQVQVTVAEYATQKVSIVGEVHLPGSYPLSTPRSILDVLALAGGLDDVASRHIVVKRYSTSEKIPYFVSNQAETALDTAMKIYPGDTVLVPKAEIVYVLGDVHVPGGYTMTNNEGQLSALQLIARAGGTPPTAVPSHARLVRKTPTGFTEMPLQISAMQKGKQPDIMLQPGDIIFVPFSYLKNFAVNATGIIASATTAAVYRF